MISTSGEGRTHTSCGRRLTTEVRESADGSITSRTYYHDASHDPWLGGRREGWEIGGRASLAISRETGRFRGQKLAPWRDPPTSLEVLNERFDEASGGSSYRDGQEDPPTVPGDQPQLVRTIEFFGDGSFATSHYLLADRTYEMSHEWHQKVLGEHSHGHAASHGTGNNA